MKREEAVGGVLIFLFGAVTAYCSLRMPVGTFRAAGSGLFPLGLGVLLMGLSAIFIVTSRVRSRRVKENRTPAEIPRSVAQVLLFMAAMVLATLLFKTLGYPVTSFLLLLGLLRILGVRSWGFSLPLSLVTAAGAYVLFVVWLKIPLPKGWIGL